MASLVNKINEIAEQYKNDYGGMPESVPDWLIADELNKKPVTIVTKYTTVYTEDIKIILILSGEYGAIRFIIENPATPLQVKILCSNVLESLNQFQTLNLNNPDYLAGYVSIMTSLLQANIISQPTKDKLELLVKTENIQEFGLSWSEENSIFVDSRIVGIARGAHLGGE